MNNYIALGVILSAWKSINFLIRDFDNMDMKKVVSESTLIPISMVIILIGFTGWLAKMEFNNAANATALEQIRERVQDKNDSDHEVLLRIESRLSNIEGKLERVYGDKSSRSN